MPEPLVEKPSFCYLVSSLCGVSLSWVSLEFKGLFILLNLIFANLLRTTDFNENSIIEIFYTDCKIHPFEVYSEFLLGWHKSNFNFYIVAIWPLILKYILNKLVMLYIILIHISRFVFFCWLITCCLFSIYFILGKRC